MRQKTKKSIITFHTTTGAMAMEKYCKAQKLPGRLIPVPGQISAGCGMCWAAEPEYGDRLYRAASAAGFDIQKYYKSIWI